MEELFCKYDFKKFEKVSDLFRLISFPELKKQFEECEGTDKRGVPMLHAVKGTSLGRIPALLFISDYKNISPPLMGGILCYVIKAFEGSILISTSFIRKK